MPLFDRYIAVDWSAANKAKSGKDSIWIGEWDGGLRSSRNPRTRALAVDHLRERLLDALDQSERAFVGFDFPFGYPIGGARAVAGEDGWAALWRWLHQHVEDGHDNVSNRFALCGGINLQSPSEGPKFWGHHHRHAFAGLSRHRPANAYARVEEKRIAERRARTAQPVWKLYGNGSVGSQALLGIAALERLRSAPGIKGHTAVWPFETDFADNLAQPLILAEIYPSLVKVSTEPGKPKDQVQVETMVRLFAEADTAEQLGTMLAAPRDLDPADLHKVVTEEGWIVGLPV